MNIAVTSGVIATLLAEAQAAAPRECCGILGGRQDRIDTVLAANNVADDPLRRFEIDPVALLAAHRDARGAGPAVLGYYHSHPAGHPVPSATDCEHASGDGRLWAIVAAGKVEFWRDGEQGFEPVAWNLCDASRQA